MNDYLRKADQFRGLHRCGVPLVLFNIWDAGSAKAIQASGAKALGTSSWSVANANGFPDGERMPRALLLSNLTRIVDAVELPVTVDLESGYGATPDEVGKTVGLAREAGAVGCNLEDSDPATGSVRDISICVARLRAARQAAGPGFFINARCDIFFEPSAPAHEALVETALERARAYRDAGADGFFVPGLTDIALIAQMAEAVPLPLNIMVSSQTPPLAGLAAHGVARVSHGPGPYLIAMKAVEEAARVAMKGG
jgi:2-methylisocitrate lyase-like PEP mutase family enzyme